MLKVTRTSQGAVDAYVQQVVAKYPHFTIEQIIGLAMLDLSLFYNEAKQAVGQALKNLVKA